LKNAATSSRSGSTSATGRHEEIDCPFLEGGGHGHIVLSSAVEAQLGMRDDPATFGIVTGALCY
jgi:hypothetical protein